jgi:succinylarginine dihydrolase
VRLILDARCREETYFLVIVETPRGHEVSVHDSSDVAFYSSTWSDNVNVQMLASIPRECRDAIAGRAEWMLREYEGGLEDTPLGNLLERLVSTLRAL